MFRRKHWEKSYFICRVMPVADHGSGRAFHWGRSRRSAMNAGRPPRDTDKLEKIERGALAAVLVAGLFWALLTDTSTRMPLSAGSNPELHSLPSRSSDGLWPRTVRYPSSAAAREHTT